MEVEFAVSEISFRISEEMPPYLSPRVGEAECPVEQYHAVGHQLRRCDIMSPPSPSELIFCLYILQRSGVRYSAMASVVPRFPKNKFTRHVVGQGGNFSNAKQNDANYNTDRLFNMTLYTSVLLKW